MVGFETITPRRTEHLTGPTTRGDTEVGLWKARRPADQSDARACGGVVAGARSVWIPCGRGPVAYWTSHRFHVCQCELSPPTVHRHNRPQTHGFLSQTIYVIKYRVHTYIQLGLTQTCRTGVRAPHLVRLVRFFETVPDVAVGYLRPSDDGKVQIESTTIELYFEASEIECFQSRVRLQPHR